MGHWGQSQSKVRSTGAVVKCYTCRLFSWPVWDCNEPPVCCLVSALAYIMPTLTVRGHAGKAHAKIRLLCIQKLPLCAFAEAIRTAYSHTCPHSVRFRNIPIQRSVSVTPTSHCRGTFAFGAAALCGVQELLAPKTFSHGKNGCCRGGQAVSSNVLYDERHRT